MDELTLAGIGATIPFPDGTPDDTTAPAPEPVDRLAELSAWWRGTGAGDLSPERVGHLWTSAQPFDPPATLTAAQTIGWAADAADAAIAGGARLLLLSVPLGSGATAPATLAANLLALDAVDAAGWPAATGISDAAWMVKVTAIRDGLRRLRGPYQDRALATGPATPDEIVLRLGDRAIAAGCAVLLRAASRRTPLLLEGVASAACAVLAQRVNPVAAHWWQLVDGPVPAHPPLSAQVSVPGARDPLHDRLLLNLRREPLLRLGLSWADGTGARLGLTLLQAALDRDAG